MGRLKDLALRGAFVISVIFMFFLIFLLINHNLFPELYRIILIIGLLILHLALGLVIIKNNKDNKLFFLTLFITIFFLFAQIISTYLIFNTFNKYQDKLENSNEKEVFSVITLINNPINSLDEIESGDIYYSSEDDKAHINETIQQLKNYNSKVSYKMGGLISEVYSELNSGKIKYMIINNSRMNVVEEDLETFNFKMKVLNLKSETNSEINNGVILDSNKKSQKDFVKVEPGKSFVLYISGGDTYTGLNHPSRSDVNLVLAVNPSKREILILSIPRDSYVLMPGLGYDKLTHAGIYGIEKSIESIENLLDIKINYYVKVNFNSLVRLVDALGGVRILNDNEFTSRLGENYYPIGINNLDGEHALDFVRERYNLPNGDIDRQRNQMKVLQAMINKAISPQILLNYNEILNASLDAVNTNMPSSVLTNLVNNQIAESKLWKINTHEIIGEGTMDLESYAMPSTNLFMFLLDEDDVKEASKKIKDTLD